MQWEASYFLNNHVKRHILWWWKRRWSLSEGSSYWHDQAKKTSKELAETTRTGLITVQPIFFPWWHGHIPGARCQDSLDLEIAKQWDIIFTHGLASTESRPEPLWPSLGCAGEGFGWVAVVPGNIRLVHKPKPSSQLWKWVSSITCNLYNTKFST